MDSVALVASLAGLAAVLLLGCGGGEGGGAPQPGPFPVDAERKNAGSL